MVSISHKRVTQIFYTANDWFPTELTQNLCHLDYTWRKKFGGMDVSDAKRLKQLEDENRKLKQMLAEMLAITGTPPISIMWGHPFQVS